MKIRKRVIDPFLVCDHPSKLTFRQYHDRIDSYTKNQIGHIYQEVFGRPYKCHIVWAKYQISYELARQMEIQKGVLHRLVKGSAFRRQYEGTMQCDTNRTGLMIRTMIPYEIKNYTDNLKESIMKKENKVVSIKKAAAAKAANRVGITLKKSVPETWVHVFKTNAKNRWTDEKISEFMHQEFPDLKNKAFDQVRNCRNHYNNGGYTKGEKPAVRAVGYDAEGNVISRGAKKAAPAPKKAESAPKTVAKVASKKVKVAKKAVSVTK